MAHFPKKLAHLLQKVAHLWRILGSNLALFQIFHLETLGLSTRNDNKISKAASFEYISCIEYWNEILLEVSTHTFSNLFITFLLTEDSYIVYSMCDFVVQ